MARRLEAEFHRRRGTFIIHINFEFEFGAPRFVSLFLSTLDQFTRQPGAAVRPLDVNIANDESVRTVENSRGLVDLGRNEPDKVTAAIGEIILGERAVDSWPTR